MVVNILRSMGVEEYEPRVLHQLLEFMHRYCAEVFQDGADYAEHSGRSQLECEDVQLAVRLKAAASQTNAPELISRLARERNKLELLPHGLKNAMPPYQKTLLETNFQLEPTAHDASRGNVDPETAAVASVPVATRPAAAKPPPMTIKLKGADGSGDAVMGEADADDADDQWES